MLSFVVLSLGVVSVGTHGLHPALGNWMRTIGSCGDLLCGRASSDRTCVPWRASHRLHFVFTIAWSFGRLSIVFLWKILVPVAISCPSVQLSLAIHELGRIDGVFKAVVGLVLTLMKTRMSVVSCVLFSRSYRRSAITFGYTRARPRSVCSERSIAPRSCLFLIAILSRVLLPKFPAHFMRAGFPSV